MTNASACAVLVASVLAAQAPPGGAAPAPPATSPSRAEPAPTRPANPAIAARDAARRAALAERADALLPRPIDDDGVRALARALGLRDAQGEQVEILRTRYRDAVDARRTAAADALAARIGAAYEPEPGGDSLAARPGPELASVLSTALDWRTALAAADAQLVLGLAGQRDAVGAVGPGLARYRRTIERDDLPAQDPLAAIRIDDLVADAALPDADRRAVEESLEPHWARVADAIAARRLAVLGADAKAAEQDATWGASWRLTATPETIAARDAQRAALDAGPAAAERALADANRPAIAALLRMLPAATGDRVRSTVDVAMWPELWRPERSLAATVAALRPTAPGPVVEMADAAVSEVMRRIEPTRKELARRAEAADAADEALAAAGEDARRAALVAALEARRAVEDLAERRRRAVADGVARMLQLLGDHPGQATALAALKAELDSAGRASAWRTKGLEDRLSEAVAPPVP